MDGWAEGWLGGWVGSLLGGCVQGLINRWKHVRLAVHVCVCVAHHHIPCGGWVGTTTRGLTCLAHSSEVEHTLGAGCGGREAAGDTEGARIVDSSNLIRHPVAAPQCGLLGRRSGCRGEREQQRELLHSLDQKRLIHASLHLLRRQQHPLKLRHARACHGHLQCAGGGRYALEWGLRRISLLGLRRRFRLLVRGSGRGGRWGLVEEGRGGGRRG